MNTHRSVAEHYQIRRGAGEEGGPDLNDFRVAEGKRMRSMFAKKWGISRWIGCLNQLLERIHWETSDAWEVSDI